MDLYQCLHDLTSDANSDNEIGSSLSSDEFLLKKCIFVMDKYEIRFDHCQPVDTEKQPIVYYANLLIRILSNLKCNLEEESRNVETVYISVKNLNLILRSVEFLIACGVRPCLELKLECCQKREVSGYANLSASTKCSLLVDSVDCLLALCQCSPIQANVISKYLKYVLAGCLHLAFSPHYANFHSKYRTTLDDFLAGVYRPFVLREFLIFQRLAVAPTVTWLKFACADYLSRFLLDSNGLLYFLRAAKELGAQFEDWRCCEAFATLVVTPPKSYQGHVEDYYENICHQVWDVYKACRCQSSTDKSPDEYQTLFVYFAKKMFQKAENTFRRIFLKELQLPLAMLDLNVSETRPTDIELTRCIENVHYFYCKGPSDSNFATNIIEYLPTIMDIYANLEDSVSYCKNLSKDLLIRLIDCMDETNFVEMCNFWLRKTDVFQYSTAENGGLSVSAYSDSKEDVKVDSDLKIIRLISVLEILPPDKQRSKFVFEFISNSLRRLQSADSDLQTIDEPNSSKSSNDFTQIDKKIDLIDENLLNLSLLSAIIERFGEEMGQNFDYNKVLNLCNTVFDNSMKSKVEESCQEIRDQTLTLCFALISLVMLNDCSTVASKSENFSDRLSDTVRRLEEISKSYPNLELRRMATNLLSSFHASNLHTPKTSDTKVVKENLPQKNVKKAIWKPQLATYEEALRDINDSLLPVRVHGIIAVTRLLQSRDHVTLSNSDRLLEIFLENVENEDSYVFLSAVNALSILGASKTKHVLDALLCKFIEYGRNSSKTTDSCRALENQLKIGETVVKICRLLGDLGPFYTDRIVDTFLSIFMKSQEETVKASCMSNVGEICQLASYKLSGFLHELIYAVETILQTDKSQIVRRSVVNLLRHLLTGTSGSRMLEIFGEEMPKVYRLLKSLYENDKDEVVRLHAQICIDIIDENVKASSLSLENSFSRKITL